MTGRLWTSTEVACDGLTYRQLDYWVRCGYIHPEVEASGSGTQRGFTGEERDVAHRMRVLVSVGVTVHVAASIARTPEHCAPVLLHLAAAS